MATATDAELALLRRLVGDTDPASYRYPDAELQAALEAAPACPVPIVDGYPALGVRADLDTYGVAALLWEDRALLEVAAGTAPDEPARVTSERNGDLAVTYAGPGKAVGPPVQTADSMRAVAKMLRRRSCNYARTKTVVVQTEHGVYERPVLGGLYPSQLANYQAQA